MNKISPVRVIAITSGKGGVGKTNVSANLGVALARMGRRTALLDADLGLANVDVLLGVYPQYNLSHVLSGDKTLSEVMVEGPSGLKIIPASSGVQKMSELSSAEQACLIHAFSDIDRELDVLLVDTAAGISGSVINFARASQEIILVVCDEPTSLTDAYAFIKLMNRDYGLHHFHILTNRVGNLRQGRALFEKLMKVTDRYLDVALSLVGVVTEDENLRKAVLKQCAVVDAFPESASSKAFVDIAKKIDAWPVKSQPGGYLEFFFERMIRYASQEDVA
ncbi:MAG: MinD/ParA family protein [Gammaproteobacteria bacterium]